MNILARIYNSNTLTKAILGFVVVACTHTAASQELIDAYEQRDRVEQFAAIGPEFLDDRRIETIRGLAPIVLEDIEVVESWHDSEDWTATTTIRFDGLTLMLIEFNESTEVGVMNVVVESPRWPMRGLGVGVTVQELIRYFGAPNQSNDSALNYFGDTSSIEFRIVDGIVTAIEIAYDWC